MTERNGALDSAEPTRGWSLLKTLCSSGGEGK